MTPRIVTARTLERMRIGNAAGLVNTPEEIRRACGNNGMTDVTIGPISMDERFENSGTTYAYDPDTQTSANSKNLPNKGWGWYRENLPDIRRLAKQHGKRLRASVVAFSPDEWARITQRVRYAGVDEIELNLGCPNVWSCDGKQKPILSYDPVAVEEVLAAVRSAIGNGIPVAAKISPVPDTILPTLTKVIVESGIIIRLVEVNTWPNLHLLIDGKHGLRFKPSGADENSPWLHEGGGGGEILCEHRRRITRYLADHLPYGMGITAVGAIRTGADILECLKDGADSVQLGTAYVEMDGPHAINSALEELAGLELG